LTERFDPAGLPITDEDATVTAALEDVSVPTLLLSMLHMPGDTSLRRGPIRPRGVFLNEVQGFLSEEEKATVGAQALDVIEAHRDGGCHLPPPPSPETIHRMMGFLVGGEVPEGGSRTRCRGWSGRTRRSAAAGIATAKAA